MYVLFWWTTVHETPTSEEDEGCCFLQAFISISFYHLTFIRWLRCLNACFAHVSAGLETEMLALGFASPKIEIANRCVFKSLFSMGCNSVSSRFSEGKPPIKAFIRVNGPLRSEKRPFSMRRGNARSRLPGCFWAPTPRYGGKRPL